MVDKILLAAGIANFLFLGTGVLQLAYSLVTQNRMDDEPTNGQDAVRYLMYQQFPLTPAIANGALVLFTFVLTLPGMFLPTTRGWLKVASAGVVVNAIFTLVIGIFLWVMTLNVRDDFAPTYFEQQPTIQGMIQTDFECCGYFNSTSPAFITNDVCSSPAAAALERGCAVFISSFANRVIDEIFTAVFGVVGVDAVFLLCIACLLKDRKERLRYRSIDQKTGYW